MECIDLKHDITSGLSEAWECIKLDRSPPCCIVVTTSLLPNNDCIEILVEDLGDRYRLKDLASSYVFLQSYGIDLGRSDQKKRYEYVLGLMTKYHTDLIDFEIEKEVDKDELWLGISLITEAIKDTCSIVNRMRPRRHRSFRDRVYTFFAKRRANVKRDYSVEGFAKIDKFDVRLNGQREVLIRAISSTSPTRVESSIERAWFAFSDVAETGRAFEPTIILDDTDEERKEAIRPKHHRMIERLDISTYMFEGEREKLSRLAEEHQR